MTIDDRITHSGLQCELSDAHDYATTALHQGGAGRFDAVVWMSAHLMASQRVLGPAIRRHAPHVTQVFADHVRTDRALHRALHEPPKTE